MTPATAKRKRRRAKQQLKIGCINAVRKHARLGGRTGAVFSKRTPGKAAHYSHHEPNPPVRIEALGGPLW